MNKKVIDILFIFPVMGYYAIESVIVGLFIAVVWKYLLSAFFGNLGYLQIVGIYWIIKMLFFDIFKLFGSFTINNNNNNNQIKTTDK